MKSTPVRRVALPVWRGPLLPTLEQACQVVSAAVLASIRQPQLALARHARQELPNSAPVHQAVQSARLDLILRQDLPHVYRAQLVHMMPSQELRDAATAPRGPIHLLQDQLLALHAPPGSTSHLSGSQIA